MGSAIKDITVTYKRNTEYLTATGRIVFCYEKNMLNGLYYPKGKPDRQSGP